MKKMISILLALAMVCCLLPTVAFASEIIASGTCGYCDECLDTGYCGDCSDNLTWTLDAEGTLTISGTGDMGRDFEEGASFGWYAYKDSIKSLVVEEGVTSIGMAAFYHYTNLTSVSFPTTLTKINSSAFTGSGIVSLELPESVTYLGSIAFSGCTALEHVTLPSCSDGMGSAVFSECISLKSVDMTALESMKSSYAMFQECHSLTNLDFYTADVIGSSMFQYSNGFTQLEIPEGVVEIRSQAFVENINLTSVTMPSTLETMGAYIFVNCDNLSEIRFTGDAPAFDDYAFMEVTTTAYYPANNATWTEDVLQNYEGDITWVAYTPSASDDNETERDETVSGTWGDNLTWVLAADGILTIAGEGEMARPEDYHDELGWYFPWKDYYDQITALVIEEGVTTVAEGAFSGCPAKEASLPETLTKIGTGAFADSGLVSIAIPDSVTNFGMSAFYGCEALTSVKLPAGLEFAGEGVFGYCTSLTTVVMPEMPNYDIKSHSSLSLYALFEGCSALRDIDFVTFPAITEFMFAWCGSLEEIAIPEGVEAIWSYAFRECENLTSVTIPASVTELRPDIFSGDTKLATLIFEGSAPEFDAEGYSGRTPLDGVTATAYYPADDATWTEEVMASYGGTITWVAYESGTPGDLNGDSTVDDGDVAQLLWYTLFPEAYEIVGNADVNGDGAVDDADVAYLLWHTLFPDAYPIG